MRRIDRRMVRNITEQTTRNALNEQQLNEWGLVKGLWNGAKNLLKGSGPGLGSRIGRSLGFGRRAAGAEAAKNAATFNKALGAGTATNAQWGKAIGSRVVADQLAANAARARGLGLGILGGGVLGASMAGGGGGTTPQPNGMPPMGGGYADPYAGAYGGYADPYAGAYADPYAGAYGGGYSNPYAGYYGGYADPYAGYYGGGYSDPYAGYYGGGYSDPYAGYYGGGSSGGDMDPMMLMYLMNQNGGSGGMDPAMIWALGGYT